MFVLSLVSFASCSSKNHFMNKEIAFINSTSDLRFVFCWWFCLGSRSDSMQETASTWLVPQCLSFFGNSRCSAANSEKFSVRTGDVINLYCTIEEDLCKLRKRLQLNLQRKEEWSRDSVSWCLFSLEDLQSNVCLLLIAGKARIVLLSIVSDNWIRRAMLCCLIRAAATWRSV